MDACDRCCAESQVVLEQEETKLNLVLCGHHYGRHEFELATSGFKVVADNRASLVQVGE